LCQLRINDQLRRLQLDIQHHHYIIPIPRRLFFAANFTVLPYSSLQEMDKRLTDPAKSNVALEQRCAAIERFLTQYKLSIVVILSILYFGGTILRARGKPFWCDEIITLLVAHQPSVAASLEAERAIDWMPPFADLLPYFVNRLAGSGEVIFRLPAMIGFWVFCLCLFGFAARRVSISFALVAMLLPFSTAFETYSFEARSYGPMLGCCGVALFCWQTAANGRKRAISVAGLALGIAGALLNHYFAIMIYLPLAGAEILRSFRRRKVDWPIWMAFIAGAIPMVASALAAMHVLSANMHPSALVHRSDYISFYTTAFAYSLAFAIPVLVMWTVWLVLGGREEDPACFDGPSIPDYELLAAVLLLLIPVGAITIALAVPPHVFADRYAILAIGGFALLIAFLAARFGGERSVIGISLLLGAILPFAFDLTHGRPFKNPLNQEPLLQQALENGPVVVNSDVEFLQFWYYAPEELKPRLLYLSDEASALEFSNLDDHSLRLRKFGLPVVPYNDFAGPQKEFLLYFTAGYGWIPEKVLHDGGTLEVVKWDHGKALLRARLK
jgi:Dolichyl-phosphate-mannose-protein mannosyltransferase